MDRLFLSAKANINTASEGVYWDLPRIWSQEDIGQYTGSTNLTVPGLALGQPAQKEFRRYRGHPATTSLSPILGRLLPIPAAIDRRSASALDNYYKLTPRTNAGGSRSGIQKVTKVMEIKNERLFPSVSDFLFAPTLANGQRALNGPLTPGLVRRSEFFLSAHSIAPETTLFNTPRIAI